MNLLWYPTSLLEILSAIYFFLPAGFANMAPPVIGKFFTLPGSPIDNGKKWKGKEIFGSHKTWRGFISAIVVGVFIFNVQIILYQFSIFKSLSVLDYSKASFWIGFLLSFGAIFGDLIKSFFKRRLAIQSGKSWIPFDQIDYVVGALLCTAIVFIPPVSTILTILIFFPLIHPLVNTIGYHMRIRDVKV